MRTGLALAGTALVLVVAGCGSSSDEDPAVAWADGVCTAVNTWTESIDGVKATFQDPSSISLDAVSAALDDAVSATKQLGEDVKALDPPELDSAAEAQQIVTDLSDSLQEDAATLRTTIDEAGDSGVSGLLDSMTTIKTTLGSMATAVEQAFSELQNLDAGGELESAFDSAGSCSGLVGS